MAVSNTGWHQTNFATSAHTRRKDIFDVTADYAGTKTGAFLKIFQVFPGLLQNLGYISPDHAGVNGVVNGAKLAKLSLKPWSFVDRGLASLGTASGWLRGDVKLFKEKYGQGQVRQITALDVIRDANGCIGEAWETTEFLTTTLITLPKEAMRIFKGINGIALTFGMVCNLLLNTVTWINNSNYNALEGSDRERKFTEMTGYLFKAAMEITYIALGIMIILSSFFQVVFSPLTFSVVSATTVVFGILEYYHENLGTKKQLQ